MAYTYLGGQVMTYQDYLDTATGHMLIAVPGEGPYDMTPVNSGLSVPPPDGRWALAGPPPASPPPPVVTVTAPVSAPAPEPAPEGGVTDASA